MKRTLTLLVFAAALIAWPVLAQEKEAEHGAAVEHAEGAEHEGGDPMAVWKWANFALLAAGLGYLISKNLPPVFAARTTEIQKGIKEAQAMKADAEKRAAEMDARMAALGKEVEALRVQSQQEMQQEGERIRQETSAAVRKLQDQAAMEVDSASKLARRQLKQYAASLALDLAEQRIRGKLDAGSEGALIDNFVADLGQGGKN